MALPSSFTIELNIEEVKLILDSLRYTQMIDKNLKPLFHKFVKLITPVTEDQK